MNENLILLNGKDKTDGRVNLIQSGQTYKVIYIPTTSEFDAGSTVRVRALCQDLSDTANAMDSTYTFTTGLSPVNEVYRKTANQQGQELFDTTTGIHMWIPEHALTDTVEISIGLVDSSLILPDSIPGFGQIYHFGPPGLQFDKTTTLAIPYTSSDLSKAGVINISDLPVYYFDTMTGEWQRLEVVNTDEAFVYVPVNALGYLVFGKETNQTRAEMGETLPGSFAMNQNYPNPFNSETHISYQLPVSSEVRLIIYEIQGRQIRELLHTVQPAGYYQKIWDGKDENGLLVPSGIYLMRIKAGDFSQILKMILIR